MVVVTQVGCESVDFNCPIRETHRERYCAVEELGIESDGSDRRRELPLRCAVDRDTSVWLFRQLPDFYLPLDQLLLPARSLSIRTRESRLAVAKNLGFSPALA